MNAVELPADAAVRERVVRALADTLDASYAFPERAAAIARTLRQRLADGEYDDAPTIGVLCERLTAHLLALSGDKHLTLFCDLREKRGGGGGDAATREIHRAQMARRNFGFARIERLEGNVGYLDLRGFHDPEYAGGTAAAAMTLLAHTDALIIDLRQNSGGNAYMGAFLSSYLVGPEPVHLTDFYRRADDTTQQSWTSAYVPGQRFVDKPLYLLTSARTISAGEAFAYDLQSLGRATVVGEPTAGAANPGDLYRLTEHVAAFIPTGRAINPRTGTNWEGTGVRPDVVVPAAQAFGVAYRAALQQLLARIHQDPASPLATLREEAELALRNLEAQGV